MGAALKIPDHELAATAEELAPLWRMSPDYWLRTVTCAR